MKQYQYSDSEAEFNRVLKHQNDLLINMPSLSESIETTCDNINDSEALLKSLGYQINIPIKEVIPEEKPTIPLPAWEDILLDAEQDGIGTFDLQSLFTEEELKANEDYIEKLYLDFNELHKLDAIDYSICALAGIIAATVDILLVGIPHKTKDGLKSGPLSDYIRNSFDKKFPEEEMNKLANSKLSKVPYDAQDNRNTVEYVEGMSAYYHRLLSLGHDPILGFIVGVFDIMTGKMTTIDKSGKIVSQVIESYSDRKESDLFAALLKQLIHFKSDITTSMGLPAPMMAVFNLFQFGNIGDEHQTIAEIVQGMYYEGYDFIHFCSTSTSAMLIEVIVRSSYCIKRVNEGNTIRESIPFSTNREKNPKLATMLFVAHSIATGCNTGKVYFTKNPMAINYTQWIVFSKYFISQLNWVMYKKPTLREKYVSILLNNEFDTIFDEVETSWQSFSSEYTITMN